MVAEIRKKLQQRRKLAEDAGQIIDTARKEGRELTGEERATFDRMHRDAEELRGDVERLEAQAALTRSLEAIGERRTAPEGPGGSGGGDGAAGESRLRAFGAWLRGGNGALSAAESRDLSLGSATQAGYLGAPQEFVAALLQAVDATLWIRQAATKHRVLSGEGLGVVSLDVDMDDADWTTEVQAATADTGLTVGKRELKPDYLSKLVKVSRKLIRSAAIDPVGLVLSRMSYKFGVTEEKAFMLGNGTGKPLGLFVASADGIPTSRDVSTNNTATAPTWLGLLAAKYSLKAGYWAGAQWVGSRMFAQKCAEIRDGDGKPILALTETPGMPDRLLGWPLRVSEYAPATFTSGQYVAVVGDMRYYWIADALNLEVQRLEELYTLTNQVGFLGRAEVDAMPVLGEAFARVKLG